MCERKTFVGNNEDYWNPEMWIWVSNPSLAKLGVVYFGFDNFYPQGGINERGLVFDGFSTPSKEYTPTLPGTLNITGADFIERVMTTCSSIADIKKLLKSYTIEDIMSAQLMFVDKSGNIIIEAVKSYQIATNFYQSSIKRNTPITCQRYLTAQKMLDSQVQPDIEYCKAILEEVHQQGKWGGTQYSNIYDLNEGMIYLYLFHKFNEKVKLAERGS